MQTELEITVRPKPARRTDMALDQNVIYCGATLTGGDEYEPIWRICRLKLGAEGMAQATPEWASGTQEYVHIWVERCNLTYA